MFDLQVDLAIQHGYWGNDADDLLRPGDAALAESPMATNH